MTKIISGTRVVETDDAVAKILIDRNGWELYEEPAEPTKEELQAILAEKGVKFDKRWGIEKLKELA